MDGNPTLPSNNNRGALRVDPNRGIIRLRCNCSSSIYHSLQTSLEKRLSASFSMAAHYTWSSLIDDASDVFNPSVAGEVAVSQDSFNRRLDRGRSTYDRPHRFAINGVYELPFMREQRGASPGELSEAGRSADSAPGSPGRRFRPSMVPIPVSG